MIEKDLNIKCRKYCNSCNRYNYPEAKYCNYCGEWIIDKNIYFIFWLSSPECDNKGRSPENATEPKLDRFI